MAVRQSQLVGKPFFARRVIEAFLGAKYAKSNPRGGHFTAQKLSVVKVQAGYGDVQVLWDVSLEVGTGELLCIIGSNGAAKTTLMRWIAQADRGHHCSRRQGQ
jgi:ABC-type polysaccharide/polyol phosphate transport system ATPase subunit